MAKPIHKDNGSCFQQHYSIHDEEGKNLFAGDKHAGLSQMGLYFIGGILQHLGAISSFTNPTTNSYKRLVARGVLLYMSKNCKLVCVIL